MLAEPALPQTHSRPRRTMRSTGDRLREALLKLGKRHGQIIIHGERNWASITFAGARHTVAIQFEGDEAVEAGEDFIADLPEHEFSIPGQLVAEARVTEVEHRLLPTPRIVVQCEMLLLEDV